MDRAPRVVVATRGGACITCLATADRYVRPWDGAASRAGKYRAYACAAREHAARTNAHYVLALGGRNRSTGARWIWRRRYSQSFCRQGIAKRRVRRVAVEAGSTADCCVAMQARRCERDGQRSGQCRARCVFRLLQIDQKGLPGRALTLTFAFTR